MPCEHLPLPGGVAILCGRTRRRPCSVEGCRNPATQLCDFPLAGRKAGATCSRALCEAHASKVTTALGAELDYCPAHARGLATEGAEGGGAEAGRRSAVDPREGEGAGNAARTERAEESPSDVPSAGAGPEGVSASPPNPRTCPTCGNGLAKHGCVNPGDDVGAFCRAPAPRAPVTFEIPKGRRPTKCSTCGAAIFFVQNPRTERWMPVEADGVSHFARCPGAAQHRRAR